VKIPKKTLAGLALLLTVTAAALLWVAQSDWLRDRVRRAMVAEVEKVTGGRAELGAFRWDWRDMTVEADRLVIHGSEPSSSAPLLSVERVRARLRILSFLSRTLAIEGVEVERPGVHLIVETDGRTNVPQPKVPGNRTVAETLLDLKVGAFDLRNGSFLLESPGQPPRLSPWSARGENLTAHLAWDGAGQRYLGTLALDPLRMMSTTLSVSASASVERDRIVVSTARLLSKNPRGGDSELKIAAAEIAHFASPVISAQYEARVSCRTEGLSCPPGVAGSLNAQGRLRFVSTADYQAAGTFNASADSGRIRNVRLNGSYDAKPGLIALRSVRAGVLGGVIQADVDIGDLDSWKAHGNAAGFDVRQLAALETKRALPYDGLISGPWEAHGRLKGIARGGGGIDASARLVIAPAGNGPAARGEVDVRFDATHSTIELGNSWLQLPGARIEVSGILGNKLAVKARSHDVKDLLPAIDLLTDGKPPAIDWQDAAFDGTVSGKFNDPKISGHASAAALDYEGHRFDALSGDIAVSASGATVKAGVVSLGDVRAQASGSIGLTGWKALPSSAVAGSVDLRNADIAKIAAMAGHKELPVTGALTGSGQITGTLANPLANADLTLSRGTVYGQPFDSVDGRLQLVDRNTQSLTGLFISGPKRVNFTARFAHEGVEFPAGTLEFNLTSNTMPLNQIALVRARQPDIHGFGKFHADGSLHVGHDAKHDLEFRLIAMNADASANSLELGGRILGDARFTTQTKDGVMQTHFESNAAKAVIRGDGTVSLDGDYPVNAHVTFSHAGLNALAALLVKEDDAASLNFDGEAQGEATITGPAIRPDQLTAAIDIPRLELRPLAGSDFAKTAPRFVFTNEGPLRMTLTKTQIRVDSAHFKAPQTDLNVDGTLSLTGDAPLNLSLRGNVNLELARTFNKDLISEGVLTLNAAVRGRWNAPDISGRAVLRNGQFRYADFSNGLTSANAEIAFSGTRATIQSFTAESGGGKVDVTGFAALAGGTSSFRLEARASQIRLRYPEGISSVSDAALTLFGTSQRSQVSGSVTVHRVTINPRSDTGAILESTMAPLQTPANRAGLIANMNLDIRIQTAPDVALQTSVAQSIEGDAALTLRGTVTNPALLGRINITQGEMVFFGNKYAINQGSISFFNPARIDPVLNIDLETRARGVDLVLAVSGPMTKLGISYRSDPPLPFADIVALIATGRAPGDMATAAGATGQSPNFQQLGATSLLGQAISNPVGGRLERFFGVSRLKIDPQLTGVTGSPEARLTMEQQITPEILFTYITDVASTSTQLIRVEWSFDRHWSAILTREENGYVGLDFAYKKRFR
jgi:translocation and assembly module TamB